jgi:hypothetical protein
MSLLLVWAIMTFSLSRYKSGAVNLLSHTSMQSRLTCAAAAGMSEIWALARLQANDKIGKNDETHFYNMLNRVFDRNSNEVPPAQPYFCERAFSAEQLPYASILAEEISAGNIEVRGHCRIYFTRLIRKSPPAFSGHIEAIVTARPKSDSQEIIEIKERRDFKIIDTRDIFDRYALYVKDYGFDYNRTLQKLYIEGLGPPVRSSVFLGSRHAPPYQAFKGISGPAPIFFDFDFQQNKNLVPALIGNLHSPIPAGGVEIPSINGSVRAASKDNVFWAVPMPLRFKPIYDRGDFRDSDFYTVEALQQGYYKTFVESAQKTSGSQYSVPAMILDDWNRCGGNYADSQVFRMVVATSIEAWNYLYAYTDARHLWDDSSWTAFAKKIQFSGLSDYIETMKRVHPDKTVAGNMPGIFGADDKQPVILEGNVFFRFFKIAFFDEFTTSMTLGGKSASVEMPAIPLHFQDAAGNASFLNRAVRVHGLEKQLMSREVDEIPVNSLFEIGVSPYPQNVQAPENLFPNLSVAAISYRYKSPEDFIAANTTQMADNSKRLKIDGIMYIESGDLDLSSFKSFSGHGMIWIGFRGDVYLGDLAKSKPADILKIFAQDGNFIIKSDRPDVKISASLLALTYFSDPQRNKAALENRGKLIPNRHGVEIIGNLAVDYLFLADRNYGIPAGKSLVIKHDPFLFTPVYPKWSTIGPVRTVYSVNASREQSFFK